jgi:hypothetical protein
LRYHPYVKDLARCAPRHPVPILEIDKPAELAAYDVLFWNPALDQTYDITTGHICRLWPDAKLYTIFDRNHLSLVYAAQVRGEPWTPSVPAAQWRTSACTDKREAPALWEMLEATRRSRQG